MASTPCPTCAVPRQLDAASPIPPHGSVVMVHGLEGTAYQRFYSDGLFYCGGRKAIEGPVTFAELFSIGGNDDARVYLVFETPLDVD